MKDFLILIASQLDINIEPASVTKEFVAFVEKNIRENPGKSSLRFNIYEPAENLKVTLYTMEKGFMMNEEMASYLLNNPDVEVNVGLVC